MKRGPMVPPAVRRGPVGSRRGPGEPVGRRGVPRGSKHESCTNTGQSSDPSDDYKPPSCVGRHTFFSGRKPTCPKNDLFFGFSVTRQTALPIQIVP